MEFDDPPAPVPARFHSAPRTSKSILGATAATSLIALYLAFGLPERIRVEPLLVDGMYWVFWLLAMLLGYVLVAHRHPNRDETWHAGMLVRNVAVASAATLVVFLAVGVAYRVLADEANLLSTAMSLHENRTLSNVVEGLSYYDKYHVLSEGVASRPGLFPFLVALLHTFFGYDSAHGFAVNFVSCAGTLVATFAIGKRLLGSAFGALAALLLVSVPVFTLSATSAGFDLLNLFMITAFCLQLLRFFERPDALAFELLMLVAVLGAYTRYETILLLVPAMVAGLMRLRSVLRGRVSWRFALIPLLLVPAVWQRALTSVRNEPWPSEAAVPTFALDHVGPNLERALAFYLHEPVFYLALFGLGLVLFETFRGKGARYRAPIALIALSLLLIVGSHMAFYLGDIGTAHNRRLAVAHLGPISLLAAYPLYLVGRQRWARVALATGMAVVVAVGLSRAAKDDVGRSLTLFREYQANLAFLADVPAAGTLVISDRPVLYVPHRFGSISLSRANKEAGRFLANLENRLFARVFVIQSIGYVDQVAEQPLDPRFQLDVVREYQNTSSHFIRISRVVFGRTPAPK